MIGRTLLHYRVVRALGSGGMGEVYAADDTRLHRHVALKLLPAAAAADPDRLSRFQREARALAGLNHPNIVTIHSVEEADGVHFLTMEIVEGETLAHLIPSTGVAWPDFFKWAPQLVDAIAAAHQHGVVHRDLKPANIMIGSGGRHVAGAGRRPAGGFPVRHFLPGRRAVRDGHGDPERRHQSAGDVRNDLEELQQEAPTPSGPVTAVADAARQRSGWSRAGLTGLALGSAAMGVAPWAWLGSSPTSAPTPMRASFSQLTTSQGSSGSPRCRPTAVGLVYAGDAAGNRDIYLQSVTGRTSINLTASSPDDDDQPAFSPDGEQIALYSERGGGGLFVMGRTGEAARRISRAGFNPAWSRDANRPLSRQTADRIVPGPPTDGRFVPNSTAGTRSSRGARPNPTSG